MPIIKVMESLPVKVPNSTVFSQNSSKQIFNKHLNVEFLNKTYGNNLLFCSKMFGLFLASTTQDMTAIESAISEQRFTVVKDLAHKIKNNFTWVGLPVLSKKMYALETMAGVQSSEVSVLFEEIKGLHEKDLVHVQSQYDKLKDHLS